MSWDIPLYCSFLERIDRPSIDHNQPILCCATTVKTAQCCQRVAPQPIAVQKRNSRQRLQCSGEVF